MRNTVLFFLGALVLASALAEDAGDLLCYLPPVKGPCEALYRRWFYNHAEGLCEEFIYGGCEGNANNFQSLEECMVACG